MTIATTWVIDGMNVVGSVPDGWWRNRERAMGKLVDELVAYHDSRGERVVVVFDGKPKPQLDRRRRGVEIVFAPGGRGAGDDEIVRRVGSASRPSALRVVTSDADLAQRVRALGADVLSSSSFRRALERATATSAPAEAADEP